VSPKRTLGGPSLPGGSLQRSALFDQAARSARSGGGSRPGSPRDASAHPQRSGGPGRGVGPARRGFTAFRRHAGMVPRAGHGRHGRPKRPSTGRLSLHRRRLHRETADRLHRRHSRHSGPVGVADIGSIRVSAWVDVRAVEDQGRGQFRCSARGLGTDPGALNGPPAPSVAGQARPQRQGIHGPTREPAVSASSVSDALLGADIGVTREARPDPRPASFRLSLLRQGSKAKPETPKAVRFTRARRAVVTPRGRHYLGVKTDASVTQNGYDFSATALRPLQSFAFLRSPGSCGFLHLTERS